MSVSLALSSVTTPVTISTPYYRSLVTTHSLECDGVYIRYNPIMSTSTYGPYDIFCLETRLYPIVYKMFNRDVAIIFRTVHENDRMEIKIDIVQIQKVSPLEGPVQNPTISLTPDQYELLN